MAKSSGHHRRRWPAASASAKVTLLAKSAGHLRSDQVREVRMPCASQRVSVDPADEAYKVHGGGYGDMLQVCLGMTEVTRSPQVEGPHALRYGGLDAGPH